MKIKLSHFDKHILKKLDDPSKLGYFTTLAPHAIYDALRDLSKKYHIQLNDSAVDEITKLIAEKLS